MPCRLTLGLRLTISFKVQDTVAGEEMADTVVSMANLLVGSAINMATSAASQEISMLFGVQNEIWYTKDELKTMQAFLRAAEVRKERDELVKVWAEQVRDLSYDIEDCLQEFLVHIGRHTLSKNLMKLHHRHRIAVQIRSLKLRVEEVSNRNMRYNLITHVPYSNASDSNSNMELIRYEAAHYVDEADLVGFAGPKNEILELLSRSGFEAQTIWIVGDGGIGKTTLAKKVYESSYICKKFPCRAWITVSSSLLDIKEIFKQIIKQLLGEESLNKLFKKYDRVMVQEHDLTDHLKEGLRERRHAWDCIKPTFWGNNMEGSRVVVTTRNKNLVGGSPTTLVYLLKPLKKNDATELLLKKIRRSLRDIEKDGRKETFENILKKCGGLPLAIITIGAVLAAKDIKEWEILYAQLP
uniref:NB-ARC domain-containing protein n=1 Tax=Leersia perrieri TaxID=77586 RepID=A0A0D9WPD4_9ORYZ